MLKLNTNTQYHLVKLSFAFALEN